MLSSNFCLNQIDINMPGYKLFECDIQDYKEAFRYFTLAADQGWVDGQLQLGIMYYCECRFLWS